MLNGVCPDAEYLVRNKKGFMISVEPIQMKLH